jgi:hypothetical protein
MSKSKIKEFITTLAFDEIRKLNKNDNFIKELRFISSVIVKTKSLHQFNTEVENAKVNVRINVEKANEKISACFFAVFAD